MGAQSVSAPADPLNPAMLSASPSTASSSASNTVSLASFSLPAGSSRRVVVFATSGGEQGTTNITATIQGDGAAVSLTQVGGRGSNTTASGSFETLYAFDIAEGDIVGSGPYTITATSDDPSTTTRMGLVAMVIEDAGAAPSASEFAGTTAGASAVSDSITPTTADSLVVGCYCNALDTTLSFASGLTAFGSKFGYGDAMLVGQADQGASALTVTSDTANSRKVLALLAYPST